MSASATPSCCPSAQQATQQAFLSILPRLKLHAKVYFRHLKDPERREEAICEMLALAWSWLPLGKRPIVFGALPALIGHSPRNKRASISTPSYYSPLPVTAAWTRQAIDKGPHVGHGFDAPRLSRVTVVALRGPGSWRANLLPRRRPHMCRQ